MDRVNLSAGIRKRPIKILKMPPLASRNSVSYSPLVASN